MSLQRTMPWVDAGKAVAAQCIVWHHLAFYGPMADVAWPLAPTWFEWLARDARMAVQVFLVTAGFLAATHVAPGMRWPARASVASVLAHRYARLALPYTVVLGVAIAFSALTRAWMSHPSIPAPATSSQVLVHLLLLQDLIGVPALSAGIWYLAIDFQLFALFVLMMRAVRVDAVGSQNPDHTPACTTVRPASSRAALIAVGATTALSLFVVNRHAAWDAYGLYFFGAYGLGVLSGWWIQCGRPIRPLLAVLGMVALALAIDWRPRIAVAAASAIVLACMATRPWSEGQLLSMVRYLSTTSFALFLLHFPVSLVVNAVFTRWAPLTPGVQLAGMALAWACSMAAAHAFHARVERPLLRCLERRRSGRPARAGSLQDRESV